MLPRDTSRQAHEIQLQVLRRQGGPRRVELAFEMSEAARKVSLSGMRSREADLAPVEARARLLRHILGEDLHRAAYGR
jgi:hypothetical protein